MNPIETCDMCGLQISGEVVRAELSFGEGAMCPSPMSMHQECYQKASAIWQPDPDSTCVVDKEYPETQQWTPQAVKPVP